MSRPQQLPIVDRATTLGGLVAEWPRSAALFERLGLDYCCGGGQTLEEACRTRGLDPATVTTMLAARVRRGSRRAAGLRATIGALSIGLLAIAAALAI